VLDPLTTAVLSGVASPNRYAHLGCFRCALVIPDYSSHILHGEAITFASSLQLKLGGVIREDERIVVGEEISVG
jgi:hypothetical protein